LGVQNIEYIQADILELETLKERFDLIESIGVLHHMEDPMMGWRVLANCLRAGGLMRIGLYSELARQDVVKLREEILKTGVGSKDFEMKLFRLNIMNSKKNHHMQILNSNDFYSLSEFRDLLFHVQEHRFTIPEIKESLFNLGLKFCGFDSEKQISEFKLDNINKEDLYNLDKWHVFEKANSRAFAGMYQFWCQKI
jgi:SAM-dependent methyltransferase